MIKEIYGNYNFWSWFRYWYIDSVIKQTIMLMDKTRVDYDEDAKKKNKGLLKKREDEKLLEFNKMLGNRYKSDEKLAEQIRKEKERKN